MSKLDGWGGYAHNNPNTLVSVGYERGSYQGGGSGGGMGMMPTGGAFAPRRSSMIKPLLHITLPDDDGEDRHFAPIILALEAMISVNLWHIKRSLRRAQQGLGNPIAPLYMSGVRYKEDDPGREDWRDCLEILKRGAGDCLPLSTLVLRDDYEKLPIAALKIGDRIFGDGAWTTVTEVMSTGHKPIMQFSLGNGRTLRCSAEHTLFKEFGSRMEEVRARDVRMHDQLVMPAVIPMATDHGIEMRERQIGTARVETIAYGDVEACGDITTDAGKFWLPESDVVVHNCDNLCAWRAAELRAAGIRAEPVIKWQHIPREVALQLGYPANIIPPGGLSMVHVLVRHPDGTIEDPSKLLGMGGGYNNRV